MKRLAILSLVLTLALTGCGETSTPSSSVIDEASQTVTVDDVLAAGTAEDTTPSEDTATPEVAVQQADIVIPEGFGSYPSVDVDLTTLSSVLVYTQVYSMMSNPDDYVGKTVKMNGTFGFYYEESVDTFYFGVVVMDATACCAQGIEFVLEDGDNLTFPDDYPEVGENVTVVGVFNSYFPEETPDWEYFHLEHAEFIT